MSDDRVILSGWNNDPPPTENFLRCLTVFRGTPEHSEARSEAFDALIEAIETRQDLAQFLFDAAKEASHIGAYEHGSSGIRSYWDSLAGVVGDGADGLPDNPWRAFAEILSGGLIYE